MMRVMPTLAASVFLLAAGAARAQDLVPDPAASAPPAAAAPPGVADQEQTTPPPAPAATPQGAKPKIAEWIGQRLRVASTTPVMERPETDAAVTTHLRKGMEIEVVGLLDDPMWLQINLPDKTIGFVLTSSIPAATGAPEKTDPLPDATPVPSVAAADKLPDLPSQPPEPATIEGAAMVFSTTVLTVNQNTYPLAQVDGFNGPERDGLEQFLHSKDDWVHCERAEARSFVCTLRDGTDVAKAALVNGAARARPNAPHDYLVQQADAQAHRRGIWHAGRDAVDAIPFSDGTGGRAIDPADNFVPGVAYSAGQPIPAAFAAAAPQDGMAFVEQQPFTLDEGEPAPVVFEPGMGWGFWDRSLVWRRAPARWQQRLEQRFPRGSGLRPVDLDRHGLAPRESFFRGPAMHLPATPGPAAPFLRSPYAAVAFHPFAPAGGFPGHVGAGFAPGPVLPQGGPMHMPQGEMHAWPGVAPHAAFPSPAVPIGPHPGPGAPALPMHGPMPGFPMHAMNEPPHPAYHVASPGLPVAPPHPVGMPAPQPNVAALYATRQSGTMAMPQMPGRPSFAPPAMAMNRPVPQAMPFMNRGAAMPATFVPHPMAVAVPRPMAVAAPRPAPVAAPPPPHRH